MKYTSPGGQVYNLFADALKQPHLLIAGATGSGKSVVINGLIYTALHSLPGNGTGAIELILIDPKRVELYRYKDLPHTICYASEPDAIINALHLAMDITEERYTAMQSRGKLKYPGGNVYVVIDEFADLMTTNKKAVKPIIQRLAQIGRAANVHIILATQTPISVVLPTEIKCNFDSRFALRTRSKQDSRNITGFAGCEDLPRYGYAYYITPEGTDMITVPYIQEEEISRLIDYWIHQTRPRKRKLFRFTKQRKRATLRTNRRENIKMSINDLVNRFGTVNVDGKTYILVQDAYTDTPLDRWPTYEAAAICTEDAPDECGYYDAYKVTWYVLDEYVTENNGQHVVDMDAAHDDESNLCKWDTPDSVDRTGGTGFSPVEMRFA